MTKRRRNTRLATVLAIGLTLSASAYADIQAARKALSSNDYDAAVQQLDKVLDAKPDDAEAQFLKGLALARGGQTEAALADFRKLTNTHPKMAEAWNNRGVLEARKGNLDAARDALRQAVKLNPSHGPAQENLGDIYVALARNAYSRAGRLEKDNSIARSKSQQLASFIDSAGGLGAAGQASANNDKAGSKAAKAASASAGNLNKNARNATKNTQSSKATQSSKNAKTKVDISTPQAAVQSWARAWSAQDVDAYLSTYSDRFKPPDDMSRAGWAASRRKHVNRPEHIDLSLSNAHVQRRGRQALVTFDQRYQSNSYHDREHKGLLLGKSGSGWKILREGKAEQVHFLASANAGSQKSQNRNNSGNAGAGSAHAQSQTHEQAQKPNAGNGSGQSAPARSNGQAPVQKQVRAALHHWAKAWSNENVQAYLDAYSNNFQPGNGKSLSSWVKNRRKHVSRPKWIKVKLSDIKIEAQGNDRVEVSFNQRYRSNSYHDKQHKQMTLVRENGNWRILKES